MVGVHPQSDQLTHDAVLRRRRDRRTSTGKRVTPQERDLLWFEMLHRHGPLSSTYLHAFSRELRVSEKRARDRLTDLYNEERTPHSGPYLDRPWQQFATFDSRYNDLVYDLAPAAVAALKEAGRWSDYAPKPAGPWRHRYMVAAITASIELATLDDLNLTYIPQQAILARAGVQLRYPTSIINPATKRSETIDLIPDALFGLEYRHTGQPLYRFFLVEADRATEPATSVRFNRKSYLRNLLQYEQYVGGGLYREHLRLTAGIMVLNVTTSEETVARLIALAQALLPEGNPYLLFRAAETFGRYFKPAKPMRELLSGPWARAGREAVRIGEV